jgi:DNA-binding NtrC family response regulator
LDFYREFIELCLHEETEMSAMTSLPIVARALGGALVASPSTAFRERVLHNLNGFWRPVQHAQGGAEALRKLEEGGLEILFLDARLPDLESEELIAIIRRRFPGIQLVLLDSAAALPADFRGKMEPQNAAEPTAGATSEESSWETAGAKEGREKDAYEPLPGMIGRSEAMQRVYRLAQLVAPRETTVLIAGPTGSGKELVARALHTLSPRASKRFVTVNCAAIPEALFESELFGHSRGAFTGAVQHYVGRICSAHGGTLFLDEVSELPFGMQAKLLRFLEQKEVQRLGTAEVLYVDVRVIAASSADLAGRSGKGEFREDLFYCLAAFPLELPPLTERREDIVPLAQHFLACMAAAISGRRLNLSEDAVCALESHAWKGNVRELKQVLERASILIENGEMVLVEHLFPSNTRLFVG